MSDFINNDNLLFLKKIVAIMSIGSSSTQTWPVDMKNISLVNDLADNGSSINIGSNDDDSIIILINKVIDILFNYNINGNILLINSIGYKYWPRKYNPFLDNNFKKNSIIMQFLDFNNVYVFNRNIKNVFKTYDNLLHSELGGVWCNMGYDILNELNFKNPNLIQYIVDIGGGSTTLYEKKNNNFTKSKIQVSNDNNINFNNIIKEPKGNDCVDKYKNIFNNIYVNLLKLDLDIKLNLNNTMFIQTGKLREYFMANNTIKLNGFTKSDIPLGFNHYFLPHFIETKYEGKDFLNTILCNISAISFNIRLLDNKLHINLFSKDDENNFFNNNPSFKQYCCFFERK